MKWIAPGKWDTLLRTKVSPMRGIKMTCKMRTYTGEFKQDSVTLTLKSESICQIAKDLAIPEATTLYSWVKNTTDASLVHL